MITIKCWQNDCNWKLSTTTECTAVCLWVKSIQLLPPLLPAEEEGTSGPFLTVLDKRSTTETDVVGGNLAMQNVLDDEHQIELIGIQKFNNVKMSQICDKNIYFM